MFYIFPEIVLKKRIFLSAMSYLHFILVYALVCVCIILYDDAEAR